MYGPVFWGLSACPVAYPSKMLPRWPPPLLPTSPSSLSQHGENSDAREGSADVAQCNSDYAITQIATPEYDPALAIASNTRVLHPRGHTARAHRKNFQRRDRNDVFSGIYLRG